MFILKTLFFVLFYPSLLLGSFLDSRQVTQQNLVYGDNSLREESLQDIAVELEALFQPYVPENKKIKLRLYWDDNTLNATAWRSGRNWGGSLFGGLLKHPKLTEDALTIVMCHVIGHHFAGYPYKNDKTWMSVEGRADYFATQSCTQKLWLKDTEKNEQEWLRSPPENQDFCRHFSQIERQHACARGLLAIESLLSVLDPQTDYSPNGPDMSHARETVVNNASAHCRYTTFVQGLMCDKELELEQIPGSDYGENRNSERSEHDASMTSCVSESKKIRWPRCWFQPQLKVKQTTFLVGDSSDVSSLSPGDHVQLFGQLRNLSHEVVRNAKASIHDFQSPWVFFDKKKTSYSKSLKPGKTGVTEEAYVGFVSPKTPCGEELSVPILIEYENFSEMSYVPLKIGVQTPIFKHDISTYHEIHDNSPFTLDIDSDEVAYNIEKVKLTLDIKHSSFDDLEIILTDPSGVDHVVEQTLSENSEPPQVVNGTIEYEIKFSRGLKNGFWELTIEDRMRKDDGILRGWTLEAFESVCENSKK